LQSTAPTKTARTKFLPEAQTTGWICFPQHQQAGHLHDFHQQDKGILRGLHPVEEGGEMKYVKPIVIEAIQFDEAKTEADQGFS
jgi:hypothetical protein